jgi:plasmid stabilization system protein ParE
MTSEYALHPEAFADLDDIRGCIAHDNPDAADQVISEIFDSIRGLVRFPHQGHKRPDLTSRPLQFILVREYLIAYASDETLCGSSPWYTDDAVLASWQRS